jgi:hypothetical protein
VSTGDFDNVAWDNAPMMLPAKNEQFWKIDIDLSVFLSDIFNDSHDARIKICIHLRLMRPYAFAAVLDTFRIV